MVLTGDLVAALQDANWRILQLSEHVTAVQLLNSELKDKITNVSEEKLAMSKKLQVLEERVVGLDEKEETLERLQASLPVPFAALFPWCLLLLL